MSFAQQRLCNEFIRFLVALGLIADMMDMKDFETKHLVEKGLNAIKKSLLQIDGKECLTQ